MPGKILIGLPATMSVFELSKLRIGTPVRDELRGLTPLPSNSAAIAAAEAFVTGESRFVCLRGPSGWGKSVILGSVAGLMSTEARQVVHESAPHWQFDRFSRAPDVLILDDVILHDRMARAQHQLTQALAQRVRRGLPTMISLASGSPLPLAGRWRDVTVPRPDRRERIVLTSQLAQIAGLRLHPTLAAMMARYAAPSGLCLHGAMQRLRLVGRDWSHRDAVLRACPLLEPLMPQGMAWDIRDAFAEGVADALRDGKEQQVASYTSHVMLRVAGFREDVVAAYMQRSPGEIYLLSESIRRQSRRAGASTRLALCKDRVFLRIHRHVYDLE